MRCLLALKTLYRLIRGANGAFVHRRNSAAVNLETLCPRLRRPPAVPSCKRLERVSRRHCPFRGRLPRRRYRSERKPFLTHASQSSIPRRKPSHQSLQFLMAPSRRASLHSALRWWRHHRADGRFDRVAVPHGARHHQRCPSQAPRARGDE